MIAAGNAIATTPYIWGGGHGSFESSGYDCSGAVSYALHGGGFLDSPLDSTGLETWGEPGPGQWITVYANSGHAWMVDRRPSLRHRPGGPGPRWADYSSYLGAVPDVHRHSSRGLLDRCPTRRVGSLVDERADPHLLPGPRPGGIGRLLREARLRGHPPDADPRRGDEHLHGASRRRAAARADPQPRRRRALRPRHRLRPHRDHDRRSRRRRSSVSPRSGSSPRSRPTRFARAARGSASSAIRTATASS